MWSRHTEIALLQAPNYARCLALPPWNTGTAGRSAVCPADQAQRRIDEVALRSVVPDSALLKEGQPQLLPAQARRREADDQHDRLGK